MADALGISPGAGFGSCWASELSPSLIGLSVIFASSISPSSTSSFPEAVLTIFGPPFTTGRGLGWKSGALGFNVRAVSLSGCGVDGFADVDLTPLVVAEPPSVKLKACGSTQSFSRLFRAPINDVAATFKSSRVSDLLNSPILVS